MSDEYPLIFHRHPGKLGRLAVGVLRGFSFVRFADTLVFLHQVGQISLLLN